MYESIKLRVVCTIIGVLLGIPIAHFVFGASLESVVIVIFAFVIGIVCGTVGLLKKMKMDEDNSQVESIDQKLFLYLSIFLSVLPIVFCSIMLMEYLNENTYSLTSIVALFLMVGCAGLFYVLYRVRSK